MTLVYGIFCILCIFSAFWSFRKKQTVYAALFTITALVSALFVVSHVAADPVAGIASWASIIIAGAALIAFGLAKMMPKDKTETHDN